MTEKEDSPEIRRNKILAAALGLNHHEVAEFVVSIQRKGESDDYTIHFGIQTPDSVRQKVEGLGQNLFLDVGPVDFQGLQYSKI